MNSNPELTNLLPDWTPTPEFIRTTNLFGLMQEVGVNTYEKLHEWSTKNHEAFWAKVIERLGIPFQHPFSRAMDLTLGIEHPNWLLGAKLNIVESCFKAPANSPAIIHQSEGGAIQKMSVAELQSLTNQISASLVHRGFKPGDAVAIFMPMTPEAVAIYLGIIQAGCVVVGIADSFRPKEISTRLRLAKAVAIFTQDVTYRAGKELPLFTNVVEAEAPPAIVLPAKNQVQATLRAGDLTWSEFLVEAKTFQAVPRTPSDPVNILFSSGTTGEPKAIPWTQTTPIKCAVDAHFHQNVQPGDLLVWPTNIGWMMGPWLIFASLMNRAALGLFDGAPTGRPFGEFLQNSKATLLGIVPSLVKAWRATDCMKGLDWSEIKVISSTGECSNAEEMRWLMKFCGGRPVIEYCGGTEIGGGYLTGTVTRPCIAGTFNTPALGLDFVILDEEGSPAENGEIFLIPPSIGLSLTLLNKDHHQEYFSNTPKNTDGGLLRRHGDQIERLPNGYWRAHGRADDTMNLGGIKVSSAEIERTVQSVPDLLETAAIAVAPGGGPSQLVIFAVCTQNSSIDKTSLTTAMQNAIRRELNPLFKIQEVVITSVLPRTASNKIMRRVLRDQYLSNR